MDVHAARRDDRTLRRIAALLVALAVLAEQAAHRSAPVRLIVLWLLRQAEAAAAEFVFEEIGVPALAADIIAAAGNGPEDAVRLAERLRVLAAALAAMLPDTRWPARRSARRGLASGPVAPCSGRAPVGRWLRPIDTS